MAPARTSMGKSCHTLQWMISHKIRNQVAPKGAPDRKTIVFVSGAN